MNKETLKAWGAQALAKLRTVKDIAWERAKALLPTAWSYVKAAWTFVTNLAHDYQEVFWAVTCSAALVIFYYLFRAANHTFVTDATPEIYFMLVKVLKGIIIGFNAWLCKKVYWKDIDPETERVMNVRARNGNEAASEYLKRDRLEYLAWLVFWLLVMSLPVAWLS